MGKRVFVVLAATALLIAVACLGFAAPNVKTSDFTFGGLGKVTHPYWDEVGKGLSNAGVWAGSKVTFENPPKEDVARQVEILEGYVAQNVDGIIFGASDPGAFDKVVQDAQSKGIPVLTFDSDAPKSGRLIYIGPNSYRSGFLAGERMKKLLPNGGKIAIQVGSLTALNAKERIQGFKDAIKGTKIQIVKEDVDGEDAQVANAHSEAILASVPDLAGFYGVYAYNAPGEARAVQAAGKKPGQIKIVGFDALDETVQFMKQGYIDALIDNREYNFGFFGGMVLYLMKTYGVDDALTMLGFDPKANPEKNNLYTPSFVIDKGNLAEFQSWHDGIVNPVIKSVAGRTFNFGGLGKVTHPYWDEVAMGVKNSAKKVGSNAQFENPPKEDVARQVQVLESYVAQNVDGIIFGASDPGAFDKVVQDAQSKGIPVLTFDSDAPKSGRLIYIGPDSHLSGTMLGRYMGKILPNGGKIAIQVGSLTALNAKDRISGFKETLPKNIRIVKEDVDQEDAQVANAHSEAILASVPDLAGFYGVYAYNAPAQARAVQAAGKSPGQTKIIGFDALNETIQFMKQGYIDAVIDHREFNFGYYGTMILYSMKIFGVDNTMTLLGFDPKGQREGNIKFTPSYLITTNDLPQFQNWHTSVFGE
ncbi:MAG: substrate-binding domain-containing protein [Spirochaetia bacterium]|jgi:ribose transport system substrate-binding protein